MHSTLVAPSRAGRHAPSRRSVPALLLALALLSALANAATEAERLASPLRIEEGRYEGQSLRGRPHGEGRMEWPDGRVYEGQFFDGQADGEGTLTWPDGLRYQGPVVAGYVQGEGRVWYPDGRLYRGPLVDGAPQGLGTLRWPDKARYTGENLFGRRHGWGEFKAADGSRYVGGYANGVRAGQGTLIAADGTLFRGGFRDGRPHGFGVRVSPRGRSLTLEQWQEGDLLAREAIRQSSDCLLEHRDQRWMVLGADCASGRAQGTGHAVSVDGTLFVRDATFAGGRVVDGRTIPLGQPPDSP